MEIRFRSAAPAQYSDQVAQASDKDVDELLKDYMAFNHDAINVLVSLYEAADAGHAATNDVVDFSRRLSNWGSKLSQVIERLNSQTARVA